MRRLIAALLVVSGNAFAHPGADGHVHGLGIEHALLFVVIAGLLVFAIRK